MRLVVLLSFSSAHGPGLSEVQYLRIRGKTDIIDALRLRNGVADIAEQGGKVVLTVFLDVVDAFNSLSHSTICEALQYFGVSSYTPNWEGY